MRMINHLAYWMMESGFLLFEGETLLFRRIVAQNPRTGLAFQDHQLPISCSTTPHFWFFGFPAGRTSNATRCSSSTMPKLISFYIFILSACLINAIGRDKKPKHTHTEREREGKIIFFKKNAVIGF